MGTTEIYFKNAFLTNTLSKVVTTLDVTFHISYKSLYSLTTEVIQNPHFSSYVCVFCSINTILNHLIMHHEAHALLVVWDGSRTHEDESPLPVHAAKYKKRRITIKVTEYYPGELALIFAFANFYSV